MMNIPEELNAAAMLVDITPPIGVYFDGYGARKDPSNDIHDPLYASVLVLKSGTGGLAIIACDLLAVSLKYTKHIRAALSPVLDIPEDCILLAASHTHSGPAGILGRFPPLTHAEDPILQEFILRRLTGAAKWAAGHLQPACLGIGRGEVHDIGRNRNDPVDGLTDYEVCVLRVDDQHDQPLALLANYGCHPTVLGPDNLAISADYPGSTRSALSKLFPGMVFLFTNGATGDVSTRFTRRSQGYNEVERMGQILAGEALKVMHSTSPMKDAELSGCTRPVHLPYRQFPAVETAQKQLSGLEAQLAQLRQAGAPHGDIRRAITKVEGAQVQLKMAQDFGSIRAANTEIQALRIGPMAVLALPGETFTKTVLDIKAQSPCHPTLVVSYGNDYCGYFPDAVSIAAGTYEALISPYDETISDYLLHEALSLLG